MCRRPHRVPILNHALRVPPQLRAPDAPALGIRIVRRHRRTAGLASTPGLVRFTGYDVKVQLGFVRLGVAPAEIGRLVMHGVNERTSCKKKKKKKEKDAEMQK